MILRNITRWFSQCAQPFLTAYKTSFHERALCQISFSCKNWDICRLARSIFHQLGSFIRRSIDRVRQYIWKSNSDCFNLQIVHQVIGISSSLGLLLHKAKEEVKGCDQDILSYTQTCLKANPHLSINPVASVFVLTRGLCEPYLLYWLPDALARQKEQIESLIQPHSSTQPLSTSLITSFEMRNQLQKVKVRALNLFDIVKNLHQEASRTKKRPCKTATFQKFLENQYIMLSGKGKKKLEQSDLHLVQFLVHTYTILHSSIGNQPLNISFLKV